MFFQKDTMLCVDGLGIYRCHSATSSKEEKESKKFRRRGFCNGRGMKKRRVMGGVFVGISGHAPTKRRSA